MKGGTKGREPARLNGLIIGPLPPPLNGMTVMTAYVLTVLSRQGVEVEHFDTSDHRGVGNVGRLDPRNVWLALRHGVDLNRVVRRRKPKLIYLPVAQSTLGFMRDALFFGVARWHRIPVVVHLHGAAFGAFYDSANSIVRRIIRFCFKGTKRAIVLGDSLHEVFGELISPGAVWVVPNGVPDTPPISYSRKVPGPPHVVFLSNLSIGKGYADVVEAAFTVLGKHPQARFTLAGEWARPAECARMREYLARRGVADRISLESAVVGLRKHELLQSADIFVFPPRQLEGQPVVLIEAMSHSLPVVTTPRGGIPDTVADGVTAVLVPPSSPVALADAISRLLEDEPRRQRMGLAGRSLYEERYTTDRFGAALAEAVS